ncbi:ABC transporter ATP-binding protein, partial [Candidatus Bathyarchaeota archaeon]
YPGGVEALRGVSCSVGEGEIMALLGPNGAGKTTLLLVMAGLLEPQEGRVLFRGQDIRELGPSIRRHIGVVFQDPDDQLFCPTVYDDIAFALRQLGLPEEEVEARVAEVASELGIGHLLSRPPYRLSYGEKRKVALATVLVYEPEVLLLDEPTASLSPRYIDFLMELLLEGREAGRTFVVATQDVDFAYEVADYAYVLVGGRVEGEGEPSEVFSDPGLLNRAELRAPRQALARRAI